MLNEVALQKLYALGSLFQKRILLVDGFFVLLDSLFKNVVSGFEASSDNNIEQTTPLLLSHVCCCGEFINLNNPLPFFWEYNLTSKFCEGTYIVTSPCE